MGVIIDPFQAEWH